MVALTQAIKDLIAKTDLFPLATASPDGVPNVVPIRYLHVADDQTLWLTDNYLNKTLANLRANPRAALYVWSPAEGQCFQIKGEVELRSDGPEYEAMRNLVLRKKPDLPARSLVILHVTEVYDCMPGPDAGRRAL